MTYVWLQEGGTLRYVNDIYLPVCNQCGKRVSECPKHDQEKENEDGN
jgi:hypothetical protein